LLFSPPSLFQLAFVITIADVGGAIFGFSTTASFSSAATAMTGTSTGGMTSRRGAVGASMSTAGAAAVGGIVVGASSSTVSFTFFRVHILGALGS
jgi:hypothetical protein